MLSGSRLAAIAILSLGAPAVAGTPSSISVQSILTPLGGNVYRYVYSITNNGAAGSAAVKLFDVLFDTSLYTSLQIVTPANLQGQWSEKLLAAVPPSIPTTYDALALLGGVAPGTTVGGFAVQFTWLGSGLPGSQPVQIFDPTSFAQLQSAQTVVVDASTIPATSAPSLILMTVGLAVIAAYYSRKRFSPAMRP
jgi:hypothetical protein